MDGKHSTPSSTCTTVTSLVIPSFIASVKDNTASCTVPFANNRDLSFVAHVTSGSESSLSGPTSGTATTQSNERLTTFDFQIRFIQPGPLE